MTAKKKTNKKRVSLTLIKPMSESSKRELRSRSNKKESMSTKKTTVTTTEQSTKETKSIR